MSRRQRLRLTPAAYAKAGGVLDAMAGHAAEDDSAVIKIFPGITLPKAG